jgi:uncharacterized membrane protein
VNRPIEHQRGDGLGHHQDHQHGHSHGDGHGLEGGWATWLSHPALVATMVALGVAAIATVAGVITLWPDGGGRQAAIAEATELGLNAQRLGATVESVTDGQCSYATPDDPQQCRTFTFLLNEGPQEGALIALPELNLAATVAEVPDLVLGDQVILGYEPTTDFYFYADRERGASLAWLAGLFAVVVIALGRARGALALGAMVVTIAVLVGFVARSVLDGHDPLLVAVVAASAIAFVSLYLTHGVNPTTTVALAGTLGALGLTLAISWLFFRLANFSGLATEEGFTLPLVADVNLASLLLGGAVLGALGALDDVTVTQVATVAELNRRNPDLSTAELITSGIRVGREHIASTVNTLLLAYAGASMPLLLLFAASSQSLATVANSELVAVEIVRTLCGSIGLVAAVPVTTALVAILVRGRPSIEPLDADPVAPPVAVRRGPPPSPPGPGPAMPSTPAIPAGASAQSLGRDGGNDQALDRPRQPDWVEESLEPDWSEPDAIDPKPARRRRRAGRDIEQPPAQHADWSEFTPRDDFED